MITLTGGGGFIGSVVLSYLNQKGINDIIVIDPLLNPLQYKNLIDKQFLLYSIEDSLSLTNIDCVIHLGAITNTLEKDWNLIYNHNVSSTRYWNNYCKLHSIPFIFASSAAVYGNGNGPLNLYAFSKLVSEKEIEGVILRFFNVYGPNEYHKGRMASIFYHWYNQLKESGSLKIFENSHLYFRDFIWVEDIAKTIYYFMNNYITGVYDVGTGHNVDYETLADQMISCFGSGSKEYIKMPMDLAAQYQTNTCGNFNLPSFTSFVSSSEGIILYQDYLKDQLYY